MLRSISLIPLLTMLMVLCVSAQPLAAGPQYGNHLYAEVLQFPSDSAGLARVDVFVRVAYDYMIFAKSGNTDKDSLYAAGLDVGIDMQLDGMTVQSVSHSSDVHAGDYESTTLRDKYLLLRQTFYLAPNEYEAVMTVSDQGSERDRILRRPIDVVDLSEQGKRIGRPMSLKTVEGVSGEKYSVYGFSGTLPFASNTILGVPVPETWEGELTVRLLPLDEDGDPDGDPVFNERVQPIEVLNDLSPKYASGVVNNYHCRSEAGTEGKIVILSLPIARHDVGSYRLTLSSVDQAMKDMLTLDTRIYWRSMPYSLRDIEFAIDAMRYVLTHIEYDRMRSGSEREMNNRFQRFWRDQDPTPETEYNERMVEYFRRVDASIDRFQTLYERNGAMTDRGKIYILFGPPADTQRVLNSDDTAEEVWSYPTLNKTFRFVDRNGNGDLRLYEK